MVTEIIRCAYQPYITVEVVQVLNLSFCSITPVTLLWTDAAIILQILQGGVTCMLAIIQVVRQLVQMHHATKEWQLNRYMGLLAQQGILSFFAYVFLLSFPSLSFAATQTCESKSFTNRANGSFPL